MDMNVTTWVDFDLESTTMMSNIFAEPRRHVTLASQIVLTLVYLCGVIGNISALVILFFKDKRRNRKHLLMLRCLATNDLVALLGMLVQMYVTIYGRWTGTRAFCFLRIVWRLFGLFSGCVAIVMAAERWLALTRPFVYQKRVTFPVIVRFMLGLWLAALSLTILPLFGFGVYYEDGKCKRYREATESEDIAYAYVWCACGTLLCLSIVWCNLAVSKALRTLGERNGSLRRVSRSASRQPSKIKPLLTLSTESQQSVSTAEERAFAKLMTVLSFSFVICWMPQMLSIPLAQYNLTLPATATRIKWCIRVFQIIADIFLCIHFTLDPYFYVLLRMPKPALPLLKPFCKFCRPVSRGSSFNGTIDHHLSSGADPPTPVTEIPSTQLSDVNDTHLVMIAL